MRIEQFYYLLEVAKAKSMSQAAKKLFITQPTLSTAIQNLEEELGVKIFKRSNNGVSLTKDGEEILEIISNITNAIDRLKQFPHQGDRTVNEIRLAAIPAICNSIAIDIIVEFNKHYPNTAIHLQEIRPEKIMAHLKENQSAIALGGYTPPIKSKVYEIARDENITIEPLYGDEFMALVGNDHPLSQHNVLHFGQLLDYPMATHFVHLKEFYSLFDDEFVVQSLNNVANFCFTDRESIKRLVTSGMAVSYLPSSFTYNDIYHKSGMMKAIRVSDIKVTLTHYLAYRPVSKLSQVEKEFIHFIKDYYENAELTLSDCLCLE